MIKIKHKQQMQFKEKSYANAVDIVKIGNQQVLAIKLHGCNLLLLFLLKDLSVESLQEILTNIENKVGTSTYEVLFPAFTYDSAIIFKNLSSEYTGKNINNFSLYVDIAIVREYLYRKKNIKQKHLIAAMDYVNRCFQYPDSSKTAYDLVLEEVENGNKDVLRLINAVGLMI